MKSYVVLCILSIVLATLLSGCNSKSVSKTYNADVETVWAAALKAAEKVSTEKPSKIDAENHKIVTGWAYVNTSQGHGEGLSITRSTDIWRGLITCEKAGSGTKVVVNIQKGSASTEDANGPSDQPNKTLMMKLNKDDTSLQDKFLAMVDEGLGIKK